MGALGDAPIKVQQFSCREISVNVKYLGNPSCTNEKLSGFELGVAHPFQIRGVFRLYKKGYRDIDVALRQLFSISLHLYRSITQARRPGGLSFLSPYGWEASYKTVSVLFL